MGRSMIDIFGADLEVLAMKIYQCFPRREMEELNGIVIDIISNTNRKQSTAGSLIGCVGWG